MSTRTAHVDSSTVRMETLSPPSSGIEGLVRRLVKQLSATPPSDVVLSDKDDADGVILEMEIDGMRCTVVRVVPRQRPDIGLSPREREIAHMVAKGYPNKTIAGVLEISLWTVGTYLRRIFAKLGVCSRAAMVARLIKEGRLRQ